ncbi:MAG: tRNA-guanine(15) transglycosylase, partial [Methanosarcinales archaeon]
VERRCRAHPKLLGGLKQLTKYSNWIENFDRISKATFFYLGSDSAYRPEVIRYANKLNRFELTGKVLIRTKKLDYEDQYDFVFAVKAPFGGVPIELSETYPFNAVIGELDESAREVALQNILKLIKLNRYAKFTLVYDDNWDCGLIEEIGKFAEVRKV